ncbi:nitrogenase component 1 [Candidatus Formimonas warabiya]|uniref:nitrogenase component 1 n=1 Tax=Formimonas warabiya TaxID=1761012 RepID=UPI0011D0C572|nr:nitrogenase component 1 [Candidatus Formimonas warabiya]
MDFIKEKTPPTREDRLAACQAFGGFCPELSRAAKKGCLFQAKRTFAQAQQGCQLTLSLAILMTMRDVVLIVHGPVGCGGSLVGQTGVTKNFQKLRDEQATGLRWMNTNLDETDVIKGGEEKLRSAVLHAEKEFRPAAIFVLNSCVPSLIGDDVDSILDEVQKQVAAKIVPIHCEGFRTKIQATAYDAVYHGILRNLMEKKYPEADLIRAEEEELMRQYRLSRTVNLINVSSMSRIDEVELVRLLKALDLNVRILPCYAHPDDFETVDETALNVSICSTHDDYFVEHVKTKYGIPFVLRTIPIGIANTNKWVMDIAKFFGLEERARKFIDAEVAELNGALASYREALKGKRAFLTGGEIRILATAELLHSLGMEIMGLKGYHFDRFGARLLDEVLEEVPESERAIFSIGSGQPFEQANLFSKHKPDLYVGHTSGNGSAARQGIPVFPLFGQQYNYMGYLGVFEVAKRVTRILKNTRFNENISRHVKLPYTSDWYRQEPFSYIDDQGASKTTGEEEHHGD